MSKYTEALNEITKYQVELEYTMQGTDKWRNAMQTCKEALEIADRLEHMDENPKISSEDATIYDKLYDDGFAEGYNYACMVMRGDLEETFCEVIKTLEEIHNED